VGLSNCSSRGRDDVLVFKLVLVTWHIANFMEIQSAVILRTLLLLKGMSYFKKKFTLKIITGNRNRICWFILLLHYHLLFQHSLLGSMAISEVAVLTAV
jgi:hypothetical protein